MHLNPMYTGRCVYPNLVRCVGSVYFTPTFSSTWWQAGKEAPALCAASVARVEPSLQTGWERPKTVIRKSEPAPFLS